MKLLALCVVAASGLQLRQPDQSKGQGKGDKPKGLSTKPKPDDGKGEVTSFMKEGQGEGDDKPNKMKPKPEKQPKNKKPKQGKVKDGKGKVRSFMQEDPEPDQSKGQGKGDKPKELSTKPKPDDGKGEVTSFMKEDPEPDQSKGQGKGGPKPAAKLEKSTEKTAASLLQMKMTTMRLEPHTEMMNPMENQSLENDDGGIDIHQVEDVDNEVDSNTYPGEDEEREKINDEVTGFKPLHHRPVVVRNKAKSHLRSDGLW